MPISDQGSLNDQYTIIPRTLIFITNKNHILLLKGASNKRLWANMYNGIGGHVEPGEDIFSSAIREIYEETGITPEDLWLCGVIIIDTDEKPGIGLYVLRAECTRTVLKKSDEGALEWILISDIYSLPLVEDLPIILPKILNMRQGSEPFSALYQYNSDGNLQISFGNV